MAEYKICFSVAGAFGAQLSFEAKPGVSYEDLAASIDKEKLVALCFLWWLVETAWIAASNRFRDICKAESLIFEYRRERKEYLWWKEHVKGNVYADDHD